MADEIIIEVFPGTSSTKPVRVKFTPKDGQSIDDAVAGILDAAFVPKPQRSVRDTLRDMLKRKHNYSIAGPNGATREVDPKSRITDYIDKYKRNDGGETYDAVRVVIQEHRTGGYI